MFPAPDDDWWKVGPGQGMCQKCHEDRLISRVEDRRGVQMVCDVCSNRWWIQKREGK